MRTLQNIDPAPEQLVILRDAAAGFRLIRGAAGSGKTTAALLRLRQLYASRLSRKARLGLAEPVRVPVLTFNRTLKGYVTLRDAEPMSGTVPLGQDSEPPPLRNPEFDADRIVAVDADRPTMMEQSAS